MGFSCQVQQAGQGEGRGQGGFRDNVALVFANLGQGEGGEDSRSSGRKMAGPGARIKQSFCSMPALQGHRT